MPPLPMMSLNERKPFGVAATGARRTAARMVKGLVGSSCHFGKKTPPLGWLLGMSPVPKESARPFLPSTHSALPPGSVLPPAAATASALSNVQWKSGDGTSAASAESESARRAHSRFFMFAP